MKFYNKIFLLFLCLVPRLCFADWIGASDKRRYVTAEEKSQFPYNNVVQIVTGDGVSTGTIIAPNVILTCGHSVADVGLNNSVQYYTTDGQMHTGTVWYYKDGSAVADDYALIVSKDSFDGHFLNIPDTNIAESNAMRIGYDSLKVLTNNEIKVVKDTFVQFLSEYKLNAENAYDALDEIDDLLKNKDCSKYTDKTKCVNCSGHDYCIFGDYDNLKVQDSCSANQIRPVETGGKFLVTNCGLSTGGSGSPLIDSNRKNMIGMSVGTVGFMIGNESDAVSYAIPPEQYKEKTKTLINMSNNGLIEY